MIQEGYNPFHHTISCAYKNTVWLMGNSQTIVKAQACMVKIEGGYSMMKWGQRETLWMGADAIMLQQEAGKSLEQESKRSWGPYIMGPGNSSRPVLILHSHCPRQIQELSSWISQTEYLDYCIPCFPPPPVPTLPNKIDKVLVVLRLWVSVLRSLNHIREA